MGVTGLWKLIEQSGTPVPLDTLENKVLAVGKYYTFLPFIMKLKYGFIVPHFIQTSRFGCIKRSRATKMPAAPDCQMPICSGCTIGYANSCTIA